jgi:hypothetical protein
MSDQELKGSLLGEEWMTLRRIASGGQAADVPLSIKAKLTVLGLVTRDNFGRLRLTERARRMIEAPD